MLLTIEKVAILEGIDIFANTPNYTLASIAAILEELTLYPGETFIEEGAIEGEVQVHSKGKKITKYGPGKSVGELAVLDPEPRSASVSAIGDAFLFRIDKEPFDEVMADRPEVAQAVIASLCRRIRDQGRKLASTGNR